MKELLTETVQEIPTPDSVVRVSELSEKDMEYLVNGKHINADGHNRDIAKHSLKILKEIAANKLKNGWSMIKIPLDETRPLNGYVEHWEKPIKLT